MKTKDRIINGRKLTFYEDGRIYSHKYKNNRGWIIKGGFAKRHDDPRGYFSFGFTINKKHYTFWGHRVVAYVCLDDYSDDLHVDHIDGDKSNNHHSNLRMVTRSKNDQSFKTTAKNATSRFRGVCFNRTKGKWQANCKIGGKTKYGGLHTSEISAALAYDRIAESLGFNPEALNRNNYPEVMAERRK